MLFFTIRRQNNRMSLKICDFLKIIKKTNTNYTFKYMYRHIDLTFLYRIMHVIKNRNYIKH